MLWDCSERLSWAVYSEALMAALNKTAKTSDLIVRNLFFFAVLHCMKSPVLKNQRDGSQSATGFTRQKPLVQ
jgi:hypothetical protein